MTLCVAAACLDEKENRIVLCSDWKQETYSAGAEIANKLRWIKNGWPTLIAGDISRADELVLLYREYLKENELKETNLFSILKEPAQKFKNLLADEFIQRKFGLSYDRFLAHAKDQLPAEIVSQTLYEVGDLQFPAQLLIAGFLGDRPVICVIGEEGSLARLEQNFAAIGTGAHVALPSLYQREHEPSEVSLMQAIYHVYEAKRLGQVSPGVGKSTSIEVLEPSGKLWSLTDWGYEWCEKMFKQLGPKPIRPSSDQFKFYKRYLEESDL
jgi:20S proteasome alpha/beta subunit